MKSEVYNRNLIKNCYFQPRQLPLATDSDSDSECYSGLQSWFVTWTAIWRKTRKLAPNSGEHNSGVCKRPNINPPILIVRTAVKQGNATRVKEALDQEGVNPNMKVSRLSRQHLIILCHPAVVHWHHEPRPPDPGCGAGEDRHRQAAPQAQGHQPECFCE